MTDIDTQLNKTVEKWVVNLGATISESDIEALCLQIKQVFNKEFVRMENAWRKECDELRYKK